MRYYIIKCFHRSNLARLLNIGDYTPRQRSFILLFLAVFTICLYSNVKICLALDKVPKFSGGAFNLVNGLAESREIAFIPPGAYNGIYTFKFSKNFTSESAGGNDKGVVPLDVKRKAIDNQSHNKSATNAEHPNVGRGKIYTEDYHLLWSLLPMFIVTIIGLLYMFFISTQRHFHWRRLFGVQCKKMLYFSLYKCIDIQII